MKKIILICSIVNFLNFHLASGQWTDTGAALQGLVAKGSTFYAGTVAGPRISTDNGLTWTATGTTGLTGFGTQIRGLGATSSHLFVGTPFLSGTGGIYRSTDGDTWEKVTESLSSFTKVADKFYESNSKLFVTMTSGAPGVSTDGGATWELLFPNASPGFSVTRLFVHTNTLYASTNSIKYDGTNASPILKSTDNGVTWTGVDTGILGAAGVFVTSTGRIIVCENVASKRVNYSDDGSTWMTSTSSIAMGIAADFFEEGGIIYMASGLGGAGVFMSSDNGATWTEANEGLASLTKSNASIFAYNGTNLLVGINAAQSNVAYLVPGAASAPDIAISVEGNDFTSAGTHDFGDVEENTQGNAVSFSVENKGNADLNITSLALSGTGASNFVLTESIANSTLNPQQSASFTISFFPQAGNLGQLEATLTIENSDPDEGTFIINLKGNSTEPPKFPDIQITIDGNAIQSSGNIDFGQTQEGSNQTRTVTITNTGENTLELNGNPTLTLGGTDATAFSFEDSGLSTSINVGESSAFTINFLANTLGNKSAQLSISNNVPDKSPFTMNLLGEVIEATVTSIRDEWGPRIQVYPNPFDEILSLEIDFSSQTDWHISIHNLTGQVVYSDQLAPSLQYKLNLSSLEKGQYILSLTNGNLNVSYRHHLVKTY